MSRRAFFGVLAAGLGLGAAGCAASASASYGVKAEVVPLPRGRFRFVEGVRIEEERKGGALEKVSLVVTHREATVTKDGIVLHGRIESRP